MAERSWMDAAACAGVDMFPPTEPDQERAARVCAGCPVADRCLEYAIENRLDDGVWGGTTEKQRRKLRRKRAAVGRAVPDACGAGHPLVPENLRWVNERGKGVRWRCRACMSEAQERHKAKQKEAS